MSDTCSTCKFWTHWRVVALTDDEPKALGHCVVEMPMSEQSVMTIIQGLTAENYYCVQHQPLPPTHPRERDDV